MGDHRNDSDGSDRHHRPRIGVLARVDLEFGDLGTGARGEVDVHHRILDRHDVGMIGQGPEGFDLDPSRGPTRDVVEHDRQVGGVGDGPEMSDETFLTGPVVVRRHCQDSVAAGFGGAAAQMHGLGGVVRAGAGHHFRPLIGHRFNHRPIDCDLFIFGEGRRFARRPRYDKSVGTVANEVTSQTPKTLVVNFPIVTKRRDYRREDTAENGHSISVLARNRAYPSNYAPPMNVIDVTEAEFQTKVIEASKTSPVVVDFWATWCEPCKTLSPILERVANEPESGFTLAKIDVDQNQRVSQAFGIQSIPTVIAFKDGRPVDMFTGAVPESQVREFLSRLVPPAADPKVVEVEALIDAGKIDVAKQRLHEILEIEPTNQEAAMTLAGLLIEESATDEALAILERQAPTAEVRQMMAAARLLASGETGVSDPEAALPRLLATVEARGEEKEAARLTMIDLFDLLGPEHPLTLEYRRRLATALF